MDFENISIATIANEHLGCIIRSKKPHQGVEAKREWLTQRLHEGHVFRKANAKAAILIEYAPLEKAWVPIEGSNYYYIYCLWVNGSEHKGKGYGKALLEYCIKDALANKKSGICMLGATKQKHWLTDQSFAKHHGFEVVDTTMYGYDLLALSFDGTKPSFTQDAKKAEIPNQELTIYYAMQCPYTAQSIKMIKEYCDANKIAVFIQLIDSLQKAKQVPCAFNNFAVFYKGKFETLNLLLDIKALERILKK